jgi:hypothetical protein
MGADMMILLVHVTLKRKASWKERGKAIFCKSGCGLKETELSSAITRKRSQ